MGVDVRLALGDGDGEGDAVAVVLGLGDPVAVGELGVVTTGGGVVGAWVGLVVGVAVPGAVVAGRLGCVRVGLGRVLAAAGTVALDVGLTAGDGFARGCIEGVRNSRTTATTAARAPRIQGSGDRLVAPMIGAAPTGSPASAAASMTGT